MAQADQSSFPDLQIEVSQPLGNGSGVVCDSAGAMAGGVPAIDPPSFEPTQANSDALNDFGCRFVNGNGIPCARRVNEGCVLFSTGDLGFANPDSTLQFCGFINTLLEFPFGDTVVTMRLRDQGGTAGAPAQLVIRVLSPTPTITATFSAAPPTNTPTVTPTSTRTRTATPSPSATRTPTRTATGNVTAATPTRSATTRPTATRGPLTSPSPTRIATRTATVTPVRTATPTRTRTSRPTPSATASGDIGPVITFFGLTRSDDTLIPQSGTTPEGLPVFPRPIGVAFSLVIEAKPGSSGVSVGAMPYIPGQPSDLQVEVSQPLGDGSPAVCDNSATMHGGVPAIDPPTFVPTDDVINALNDFGCRFENGSGNPGPRGKDVDPCVMFPSGDFGYVNSDSTTQYCGSINAFLQFPSGDTAVTARLRDAQGHPGPPAQLVVRVGS